MSIRFPEGFQSANLRFGSLMSLTTGSRPKLGHLDLIVSTYPEESLGKVVVQWAVVSVHRRGDEKRHPVCRLSSPVRLSRLYNRRRNIMIMEYVHPPKYRKHRTKMNSPEETRSITFTSCILIGGEMSTLLTQRPVHSRFPITECSLSSSQLGCGGLTITK